jgi:RHH-type proline utilization regulon transcriptional repressor/proline dehydrogenase/delta 1-pyrroline-5-carboxylate dehydrogenase
LPVLKGLRSRRLAFTVDLLGEYCVSKSEAETYLQRYLDALESYGKHVRSWPESSSLIANHPGELSPICISVKLSALYARCEPLNFERSVSVLTDKLIRIARKAKAVGAQVYVDSEDSANNPIILETFFRVFGSDEFKHYPYPGIVLQAYAKDSTTTFESLLRFAKNRGNPIAVRLVKGAYWDAETIVSSQNHWESPLFSQKESSDAQYELLSRKLLDNIDHFLPAFGSHNIRSLSFACAYADSKGIGKDRFELQALFGMAEPIARSYEQLGYLVRLYVPLGEMIPGMGYLIRRLLENTSNESFLRHTFFDEQSIDKLLRTPQMKD